MKHFYGAVFCLISLSIKYSFAQQGLFHPGNITFRHYSTTHGLSDNNIHCVLQDKRGFMWFGTDDGLNRFDGREFIVYKNNPSDSTSISGNIIKCMLEAPDGRLWIGTANRGLSSYDPLTNRFRQFRELYIVKDIDHRQNKILMPGNKVNCLYLDDNQILWIGFDKNGLQAFNTTTLQLERTRLIPGDLTSTYVLTSNEKHGITVYTIASDSKERLITGWVGNSLSWLQNDSVFSFHNNQPFPFSAHTLNTIFSDSKRRIWCGAWDNLLHRFDLDRRQHHEVFLEKSKIPDYNGNEIVSINEDPVGNLWLGTRYDGLIRDLPYLLTEKEKSILSALVEGN